MNVETHISVTLDEDGDIVSAYRTISEARHAVESDDYLHAEEREYWPDVPLCDLLSPFEGVVTNDDPLVVDNGETKRTIDDVDESHDLEIGDAVRVESDGIRKLDYNPVKSENSSKEDKA